MSARPRILLSLAASLATGLALALAQDTLPDTDPRDPEEPEPVAEALLDPIPVTLGADDFEFAFELIRFDLQQAEADTTPDGKVSFEIALESKPSYISDFKLDKTVLTFDPEAFTGKIIASLDVAEEASPDGSDEIVLLLTAKDEATQPQEGKITIPLELLEPSDLFLLARVHTQNSTLTNLLLTVEGLCPEEVPSGESIKKAYEDDAVPNPDALARDIAMFASLLRDPKSYRDYPHSYAATMRMAIADELGLSSTDITTLEDLVQHHIENGTPLGVVAQHLNTLVASGIETFYVAATLAEGDTAPKFTILRPPPPPELDEKGDPKLDAEGNPIPEEGRDTKWEAFQKLASIVRMTAHDIDGWMVATLPPPIDPQTGVTPPLPEGADAESALLNSLPTRLMEGMLDESKAEGIPLLQALEDTPPSDVSIAFLMPTDLREEARAGFEKSKSGIPAEERHLIPIVDKLLEALDHEWIRVSIAFGADPDLELLAKFEDERIPGTIREAYGAIIAEAVKAIKVEPHKDPKIMRVRQHNRGIYVGMLGRIKLLTEEDSLQLEEPEKLIKAVLTDALGLQGEPYDHGWYDDVDDGGGDAPSPTDPSTDHEPED